MYTYTYTYWYRYRYRYTYSIYTYVWMDGCMHVFNIFIHTVCGCIVYTVAQLGRKKAKRQLSATRSLE